MTPNTIPIVVPTEVAPVCAFVSVELVAAGADSVFVTVTGPLGSTDVLTNGVV